MKRSLLALILISSLLLGLVPMPAQALSYSGVILASLPERYYRLDETSGTVMVDSAWGVNGTFGASITLNQSGAIYDGNAAVEFAGATNSGNMNYASLGLVGRSWASELWFLTESSPANNAAKVLSSAQVGSENANYSLGYTTAGGYKLTYTHGGLSATLPITITANTWHYTVLQYNYPTGKIEIYLDAALVYTTSDTAYVTHNASMVFSANATTMGMKYDELAFYGRTLTQGELNLHMAAGAAAQNTATPTSTDTPTITYTPSNTPTPTVTPTLTPGWDYQIILPSGQIGAVKMEASAGDIAIIMLLFVVAAVLLLTIYLARRSSGNK